MSAPQEQEAKLRSRILRSSRCENGCWVWNNHLKNNGYGTLGAKVDGRWKTLHAHRVSYSVFIGTIPKGLDLDHVCRNRACVNPMHLEPVSRSENLLRSPLMGRQSEKECCPKGHEYSGINSRGQRICHECAKEATRNYRRKQNG